jgi:hypothetical protein
VVDITDATAAFQRHPDVVSCSIDEQGTATLRFRPGAAVSANALLAYLMLELGDEHPITRITVNA